MPGLLIGLFFAGCAAVLAWAAERQRQDRLVFRHDPVLHDLAEIQKIAAGKIPLEAARFEVRQANGTLIDDPDAAGVAALVDELRAHPPKRHFSWP